MVERGIDTREIRIMELRAGQFLELRASQMFLALIALAAAALGFALLQQYAFGYAPCELCLWQRMPWMLLIGLGALAWSRTYHPRLPRPTEERVFLALAALLLFAGAGIAVFHTGVEQHWWQGLSSCGGGGGGTSVEELRARILAGPVTRCDEAAWTFLGLSMATWNFFLSAAAGAAVSVFLLRFRPTPRRTRTAAF
jgi:disulfide bond formation protein DsbB